MKKYAIVPLVGGCYGVHYNSSSGYHCKDLISAHYSERDAKAALKRYEISDKRRARGIKSTSDFPVQLT